MHGCEYRSHNLGGSQESRVSVGMRNIHVLWKFNCRLSKFVDYMPVLLSCVS